MSQESQAWLRKAEELQALPRRKRLPRIVRFLKELRELSAQPEQAASVLRGLLDAEALHGLEMDGRTVRAEAVELLLSLGYPHALLVRPEDLLHLHRERHAPLRLIGWIFFAIGVGLFAAWWLFHFRR